MTWRMCRVPSACCWSLHSSIRPLPLTISTIRTALEALVQSGYQPSRTLVLSVLLGEVRRPFHPANRGEVFIAFRESTRPPMYGKCLSTSTPRTKSMESIWVSSHHHRLSAKAEDSPKCLMPCAISLIDCTGESPPYFLFRRRPNASGSTVVSTRTRRVGFN